MFSQVDLPLSSDCPDTRARRFRLAHLFPATLLACVPIPSDQTTEATSDTVPMTESTEATTGSTTTVSLTFTTQDGSGSEGGSTGVFTTVETAVDTTAASTMDLPMDDSTTAGLPFCGDGVLDVGEACDDGNAIDDDACSNTCVVNYCGDGVVQQDLGEECDTQMNCSVGCEWGYVGFITNDDYIAFDINGIAGAKDICNKQAEAMGFSLDAGNYFLPWLATDKWSPVNDFQFDDPTRPILRLADSEVIADDFADLISCEGDDCIQRTLRLGNNQDPDEYCCGAQWSNVTENGALRHPLTDCGSWGAAANEFPVGAIGRYGEDKYWALKAHWTDWTVLSCDEPLPIFCIQVQSPYF